LGAGLINDVRALGREGAIDAAKNSGLPVCLMHMQGQPQTMQESAHYESVVDELLGFFSEKIQQCKAAGISKERLILDPGIGFGKKDEHNLELIRCLNRFTELSCPILIGVSRKSLMGRLMDLDLDARLAASLGFAYEALLSGARIIRVHDVKQTRDICEVYSLLHAALKEDE
jgi:dihydropteroate synthase